MNKNGIESGSCVKCGQMAYVTESQFVKDSKTHIHWSCKEENKEELLRQKLHNSVDVMSLDQLEALDKSLFG